MAIIDETSMKSKHLFASSVGETAATEKHLLESVRGRSQVRGKQPCHWMLGAIVYCRNRCASRWLLPGCGLSGKRGVGGRLRACPSQNSRLDMDRGYGTSAGTRPLAA